MLKYITQLTCNLLNTKQKHRLRPLKGVFLFIAITLVVHLSFRAWVSIDYFPIGKLIHRAYALMVEIVFAQSRWVIQHMIGYEATPIHYTMYFAENGYIAINEGCSGLKQFLQVGLLFLIYPGPWRHKLWFISLGILLMHLTNLFRIIGLSVVLHHYPDIWKFSHDNVFRPLFYVVIFTLWVVWEEKFAGQGRG